MKNRKQRLLVLLNLLSLPCLAQVSNPSNLTGRLAQVLDSVEQARPAEKVYLQTDESRYSVGDNIWLKAYLTAGSGHYLSQISDVINVVLATDSGQVLLSEKLQANYGLSHSDFHLPPNIRTGDYYLAAYTNYMLNDGAAYFFRKKIYINNPELVSHQAPSGGLAADTVIRFYPESGHLVNCISSAVAYAPSAAPVSRFIAHGEILDNTNRLVTSFAGSAQSVGSFYLYPEKGKSYHALLTFNDSLHQTLALPAAQNAGYVMAVSNRTQLPHIGVRISYSNDDGPSSPADSSLILIASSGARIAYSVKLTIKNSITAFKVPRQGFPSGLIRFSLFKTTGEFLCDRFVFLNNANQLNLTMGRGNGGNNISLQVKNSDGSVAKGSFSVAVIKNDPTKKKTDLVHYLTLLSDIKGEADLPDYFFDSRIDSAQVLDLLILTHHFRQFDWQAALAGQFPPITYQPEKSLSISGNLIAGKGQSVSGGHITLFNKTLNIYKNTIADKSGHFSFDELIYPDSTKFSLRAAGEDGSGNNISVKLDEPELPSLIYIDDNENKETDNSNGKKKLLANVANNENREKSDKFAKQLKTVEIKDKRDETRGASAFSANLNGPGRADYILTAQDLENQGGQLTDVLIGKIPGVTTDRIRGTLKSQRAGSINLGVNMLIILDGVTMLTSSKPLNFINPSDIQSIEILLNPDKTSIYGSQGGNGVAIITTKHGGEGVMRTYADADIFRGFYQPHVFNPDQSKNTVFWNPDLVTDANGNISFTLPNALLADNYSIVVEGISLEGKPASAVFNYVAK
jgi:TonB-dependent SusC/RagA subfamily outer membrane receptor